MGAIVFLAWVYCMLSWLCMLIDLFAPKKDPVYGSFVVRGALRNKNATLAERLEHAFWMGLELVLAPIVWAVIGAYELWKRQYYRDYRAWCKTLGHVPCA